MPTRLPPVVLPLLLSAALFSSVAARGEEPGEAPAREEVFKPLSVISGPTVLPLSGLAIDLPPSRSEAGRWLVSASWSLADKGRVFEGRDVIDEKAGDTLVGGTWVMLGHFDDGGCAAVVKAVGFTDGWTAATRLHGTGVQVAGGTFTFASALGARPALALCADRPGRKALLVLHFFLQRETLGPEVEVLASLGSLSPVDRILAAWRADAARGERPLALAHVRNRGALEATRRWEMPRNKLALSLPADGQLWLTRPGDPDEPVDWFERLAPALPELEVEVAWLDGLGCEQLDLVLPPARAKASPLESLPEGWVAGPTLLVGERPERTACFARTSGLLLVGVFAAPVSAGADARPLLGLLGALEEAVRARP